MEAVLAPAVPELLDRLRPQLTLTGSKRRRSRAALIADANGDLFGTTGGLL
jgi:hypothetical protein